MKTAEEIRNDARDLIKALVSQEKPNARFDVVRVATVIYDLADLVE